VGVNDVSLLKVNPGDIIGIPAEKDAVWGFVLGRIIMTGVVTWIEVFSEFSTNFQIDEKEIEQRDFSSRARLFDPVYVALDFGKYFGKVKWPILGVTPSYTPEQSNFSDIEFEGDSYQELGIYYKELAEHTEVGGLRRNLEDRTIYSNPQLVRRINLYLSGYFEKGTPWNSRVIKSVIDKEGMDWWVAGINSCNDKADAVALEFKERGKRRP
jgi:hypothetical protein